MPKVHTDPTVRVSNGEILNRPPRTERGAKMNNYRQAMGSTMLSLVAALVLSGCANPGQQDDSSTAPSTAATSSFENTQSGNGSSSAGNGSEAQSYSWGLPASDTSVAGNDGPAYAALQNGCAEGQAYLDAVTPDGYGFRSPLNVVLFAAGLKLCTGDVAGAGQLYAYGTQRYGLSGLPEGKPECELYKSVRSVLEQQPRTAFPCPGGLPPENIVGPAGLVDDPLTMDFDESQPTDTPTPTEDPGTPTTATETSSSESPAESTEPTQSLPDTSGQVSPTL